MPSLKSIIATVALATLASAKTVTVTAKSDNTFDPSTVEAESGDIIEFHFEPSNHSVVSGNYDFPCSPMQLGTGFFSGYINTESGEADKKFRVTVNSTDPMPFYSSQGGECPGGMVGMINPNDDMTLDDYKQRAGELARAVDPGAESFGGEVVDSDDKADEDSDDDNNDNNKDDDKDGDDNNDKDSDSNNEGSGNDKDGAAGLVQVPVITLLGAIGIVTYML